MKNWVILFARTGSEEKLVQILKEKLDAEEYLPFVPTKEMPYVRKGITRKVRKPLFPGYVFVQTEIAPELIADNLREALEGTKDIYSLLHYGSNTKDVAMRESERSYWERLFDADFCITGSIGFFEDDRICVTSGALMGLEKQIKRIKRHNREAIVEMEMLGTTRAVTLMFEVM
jgi:transcriptional antiterminator NusG